MALHYGCIAKKSIDYTQFTDFAFFSAMASVLANGNLVIRLMGIVIWLIRLSFIQDLRFSKILLHVFV